MMIKGLRQVVHDLKTVPHDDADLPHSGPTEVRAAKTVVANGSGLAVNVTKEARLLGLGRGDAVEIVMRRL